MVRSKPGLGLGAVLWLGTTQENPQQQLLYYQVLENTAYSKLRCGSRYHSSLELSSPFESRLVPSPKVMIGGLANNDIIAPASFLCWLCKTPVMLHHGGGGGGGGGGGEAVQE